MLQCSQTSPSGTVGPAALPRKQGGLLREEATRVDGRGREAPTASCVWACCGVRWGRRGRSHAACRKQQTYGSTEGPTHMRSPRQCRHPCRPHAPSKDWCTHMPIHTTTHCPTCTHRMSPAWRRYASGNSLVLPCKRLSCPAPTHRRFAAGPALRRYASDAAALPAPTPRGWPCRAEALRKRLSCFRSEAPRTCGCPGAETRRCASAAAAPPDHHTVHLRCRPRTKALRKRLSCPRTDALRTCGCPRAEALCKRLSCAGAPESWPSSAPDPRPQPPSTTQSMHMHARAHAHAHTPLYACAYTLRTHAQLHVHLLYAWSSCTRPCCVHVTYTNNSSGATQITVLSR